MNRVKRVSRLWQQQRPRILADRARWQRARRARRSLERATAEREERDRARGT